MKMKIHTVDIFTLTGYVKGLWLLLVAFLRIGTCEQRIEKH